VKDAPVDAPSPAEDLRRKAEPTDPSFGAFLKRLAALFQNDFNLILHTFGFSLAFGITMMVFHPIRFASFSPGHSYIQINLEISG